MRVLRLTSPLMRGEDVRHLQGVLNDRLAHYKSRRRLVVDGVFGRNTAHELADVGYIMGMEPPYNRPTVVERVLHPSLLTPPERHRSAERLKARTHHIIRGANPLAALPVIAQKYVGVHENPANSNWGFPNPGGWEKEFGFTSGVSWCGCFAGAMIRLGGGHVSSRVAFCPYIEADARSRTGGFDLWRPNHNEGVGPGWLALFNWEGGSEPEHVEIVKEVHSDHLICVGGNTGGSNPAWGGMVGVEYRPFGVTVGYARPRF